jgi:hypothetical protein
VTGNEPAHPVGERAPAGEREQEWRVRELVRLHDELDGSLAREETHPIRVRMRTILGLAVAAYLSITPIYLARGTGVQWIIVLVTLVAWLVYGGTEVAKRRRIAEVRRRISELEDGGSDDA